MDPVGVAFYLYACLSFSLSVRLQSINMFSILPNIGYDFSENQPRLPPDEALTPATLGRYRLWKSQWLQAASVRPFVQMAPGAGHRQARILSWTSKEAAFPFYRVF